MTAPLMATPHADPIDLDALRQLAKELKQDKSPEGIRKRLQVLGQLRAASEELDGELHTEIEDTLVKAEGVVPKTECADLLQMHRTTLYRVYRAA